MDVTAGIAGASVLPNEPKRVGFRPDCSERAQVAVKRPASGGDDGPGGGGRLLQRSRGMMQGNVLVADSVKIVTPFTPAVENAPAAFLEQLLQLPGQEVVVTGIASRQMSEP